MEMKPENTKNNDPKGNQGAKSVTYKLDAIRCSTTAVIWRQYGNNKIIAHVYGIIVL